MIRSKFNRFRAFITRASRARPLALTFLLACAAGCDEQGAEGDRCNPYDSHNDCSSGLVCAGSSMTPAAAIIPFCPEDYCCPVDENGNVTGTSPFCQPGCNGGAAAICTASMDPGACLLADGGSLQAALELDDAGGATAPAAADSSPPSEAGSADAGSTDGGSMEAASGD